MDAVDITIGTVPIYEAGVITLNKKQRNHRYGCR